MIHTTLFRTRVCISLDAEIVVEWPPAAAMRAPSTTPAVRQLLDHVVADAPARTFYIHQAAAMPFMDWPGGKIEAGLEWLNQDRRILTRIIRSFQLNDQLAFGSALRGETDGELDAFLAAFRVRYLGLKVEDISP